MGLFNAIEDDSNVYMLYNLFFFYFQDGNVIYQKNKIIDPLPPVDHDDIEYEKFNKNFLVEHSDVANLMSFQVNELRHKLGIKVGLIHSGQIVQFQVIIRIYSEIFFGAHSYVFMFVIMVPGPIIERV